MKEVRIWTIKFGNWTSMEVIANNAKAAMNEAIKQQKTGDWGGRYCQLHDITNVELIASAER